MSISRSACPACGALNGTGAQFCGQCFAPMSSSPAAPARTGAPGLQRRAADVPWSPAPAPERRPEGMPIVTDGSAWILRLVLVAVMFAAGWAGQWYLFNRPHTVEAKDGTFSVTYSNYWDETDLQDLPPIPGFSPDLAVENENSGLLIMHMPAPPGAEESLARALNQSQLEQIIGATPWPGKLESSVSPGTTTFGGKKVVVEAKAAIDFEGTSGKLDFLVGLSPDESIVLMVVHGCVVAECTTSDSEFKDVLDSIEFAQTSQETL